MTDFNYTAVKAGQLGELTRRERIMAALLERARDYLPSATRDPVRRCEDDLPRLLLVDASEARGPAIHKRQPLVLTVSVWFADQVDVTADTLSQQAAAHVCGLQAALLGHDRTIGGLCDGLLYESSTINYPAPGEIVLAINVLITVLYSVDFADPFTS